MVSVSSFRRQERLLDSSFDSSNKIKHRPWSTDFSTSPMPDFMALTTSELPALRFDDHGRLRSYTETAQERQERYEFTHRHRKHERSRSTMSAPLDGNLPAIPIGNMRDQELDLIECSVRAATSEAEPLTKLNQLLNRVRTIQNSEPEPRIMGTCVRLAKAIQSQLASFRIAELAMAGRDFQRRRARENDLDEDAVLRRLKRACRAHRMLDDVALITATFHAFQRGGNVQHSILRSFLWRTEEIIRDADVSRYLRLQVNARIAKRALLATLQGGPPSSSDHRVEQTGPKDFIHHHSSPSQRPSRHEITRAMSHHQTYRSSVPVHFQNDGDESERQWEHLDDSSFASTSSSSSHFGVSFPPSTLDGNVLNHSAGRISSATWSSETVSYATDHFTSHPAAWWSDSDLELDSSLEDDDDDFEEDEEEREKRLAREAALAKLCQASGWVKTVRDAEPVVMVKRQTRISRIPQLLTVGEVGEDDDD